MAFQSVPNTAEIIIRAVMDGQNIVNTFYALKTGGYTATDLQNLADAVDAYVDTAFIPLWSTAFSYVGTTVRGLTNSIDFAAEANANAGSGTASGAALPNNAALSIKRRSEHTGRGARGRVFWSGLTEAELDTQNSVSPTFAAGVEAALAGLESVLTGQGFVGVVVHRVAAGVPLATALTYSVVEWVVVDRVIDSMRRRLPGRGS